MLNKILEWADVVDYSINFPKLEDILDEISVVITKKKKKLGPNFEFKYLLNFCNFSWNKVKSLTFIHF